MRVIGIFSREEQASAAIDSLKNMGFDRKDMIVSDANKFFNEDRRDSAMIIDIETEREGLSEKDAFADFIADEGEYGIILSVEALKNKNDLIKEVMIQSGARKIIDD
ncbi:MAG: hypothetical protein QME46_11540 [Thermoanaerobacteraceae bacterium]|nr:hypothetical protein [Thermoanaerobacteraceae bacterium]